MVIEIRRPRSEVGIVILLWFLSLVMGSYLTQLVAQGGSEVGMWLLLLGGL